MKNTALQVMHRFGMETMGMMVARSSLRSFMLNAEEIERDLSREATRLICIRSTHKVVVSLVETPLHTKLCSVGHCSVQRYAPTSVRLKFHVKL